MEKPLSLKIQEFQQTITQAIDQAGLPIYILKYQIKDLLLEIEKLEQNFAQQEIEQYYQSQQQTEEQPINEDNAPK